MSGEGATKTDGALGFIRDALGDAWPGEPLVHRSPNEPPGDEARQQLRWARGKYDSIIRWVLVCFTAIGLLIFGSVPFVDLSGVNMLWITAGLVLAGLGLGIVIWAATRALEPEDASLGELKETLDRCDEAASGKFRNFISRRNVRLREALRLRTVLIQNQMAHFGPGIHNVDELLTEISHRETAILFLSTGYLPSTPSVPQLPRANFGDELVKRQDAIGAALRAYVEGIVAWVPLLVAFSELQPSRHPESADALWERFKGADTAGRIASLQEPQASAAIAEWAQRVRLALIAQAFPTRTTPLDELRTAVGTLIADKNEPVKWGPTVEKLAAALKLNDAQSAQIDAQRQILQLRLERRGLLLSESAISQLRGTFRLVRRRVFLGALLTLAGGLLYTSAVANPSPGGLRTPVMVSVLPETAAARSLDICNIKEDEGLAPTAGSLINIEDIGERESAFRALIADGPCTGVVVDVAKGEGAVILRTFPEANGANAASVPPEVTTQPLAAITITPRTKAWLELSDACALQSDASEPISVSGYIRVGGGPLPVNGPFDVAAICPGDQSLVELAVKKNEGTFSLP